MFDLIIRNGHVVDGSGMPGFTADVGITDGMISEVGRVDGPAKQVIQADGRVVAPGFIDHHTHMDAQILWDPLASSACYHGVTSIVMGNCGLTLAPVKPGEESALVHSLARVEQISISALEQGFDWTWSNWSEYTEAVGRRLGVNVGMLVGHCALRQYVMGEDSVERTATPEETAAMAGLLRECLREGALGLSTNQSARHVRTDGKPIASRLAAPAEIEALADVLGEFGHAYLQWTRGGLDAEEVEAYSRLSARIRRPVLWQAVLHRWDQPDAWRAQLQATEEGFARGGRAYGCANTQPHVRTFTLKSVQMFDEVPTWCSVAFLPEEVRKQALRDPETRAKLRWEAVEDPKRTIFSKRWDLITVRSVTRPEHGDLVGKSLTQIAREQRKDVLDAFLDLTLAEDLETEFTTVTINGDEDAVAQILTSPYVVMGISDAGAHSAVGALFGYATHLLGHWVRERPIMSLEQAVRRLTFDVAAIVGLRDRGLVRPGYAADLVVFDPTTVGACEPEVAHDFPNGERRMIQRATGVDYVVVNGSVLLEDGEHSGAFPGQLLGRPVR